MSQNPRLCANSNSPWFQLNQQSSLPVGCSTAICKSFHNATAQGVAVHTSVTWCEELLWLVMILCWPCI